MTHKHLIKGAVVLGTTQGQHLVAVALVPPSPRALEAGMANELVGRFNPTATQGAFGDSYPPWETFLY